jgi:transposase
MEVGVDAHWGAVPPERDAQPVQRFGAFTGARYALAAWLRQGQIAPVVLASTGVYGIALCAVLAEQGFDVKLVAAHHARQVPGRKPDGRDCQWLQELHPSG